MHTERSCHRTRLATNSVVSIDRCSCSTIHVNVGALSLRFTGEAFERLASAVCEALGRNAALVSAAEQGQGVALGTRARGEA